MADIGGTKKNMGYPILLFKEKINGVLLVAAVFIGGVCTTLGGLRRCGEGTGVCRMGGVS
jgi:hypothetical protein